MSKLNLDSLLGNADLDLECPGCNHTFRVKFKQISQDGNVVKCPSCHEDINISHDDQTKRNLPKADKALKDFQKTIKKFGK